MPANYLQDVDFSQYFFVLTAGCGDAPNTYFQCYLKACNQFWQSICVYSFTSPSFAAATKFFQTTLAKHSMNFVLSSAKFISIF